VWSIIQAAGWPIWPLIGFSIAALALVIERSIALRRMQVMPPGMFESALATCERGLPPEGVLQGMAEGSVQGRLFAHALSALRDHPGLSPQTWRSSFEEAGRLAHSDMQRYLGALGTIASAAPLLGLLGTVIGMIEIFANQTSGLSGAAADPAQLAHGISVALYNTAFGLMVAIPSLIAWRLLRAKVDAYTLELEVQTERFWRRASITLCQPPKPKTR
jgi:biopolymer transport protein ExbB